MTKASKVTVRWLDGFKKEFEVSEFQAGEDHLWLHLSSGRSRWIPNKEIRWFEDE